MLKCKYFPSRLLDVLDVTIKKGKVNTFQRACEKKGPYVAIAAVTTEAEVQSENDNTDDKQNGKTQ